MYFFKKNDLNLIINVCVFSLNVIWLYNLISEGAKESKGGVAYDYILKPADAAPRPSSPPKEKPLTADEITKKLLKAEERRQV